MPALNEAFARRPTGGMIVRSKITLSVGTELFKLGSRFVNSTLLSDEQVLASRWWISRSDYEEIERRARAAGEPIREVWRRYCAIARQWGGSGELFVRAEVAALLVAYVGPGTIQDFRDRNPTDDLPLWVPPTYITQVCIPGLQAVADGSGKPTVANAYRNVSIVDLSI